MRKGFIIISLASFLFSCREKAKDEVKVVPSVRCFSAIMFSSGSDTVRHYFVRTYLFKGDSVLALKPDSLYHWKVTATHLPAKKLDSINQLIRLIDFKSCMIQPQVGDHVAPYCFPKYGFIDSLGQIGIFVPDGKEKTMNSLLMMLDGNSVSTNDTSEIIDYTVRIKRKYLRVCPRPILQEVKFIPPVNE